MRFRSLKAGAVKHGNRGLSPIVFRPRLFPIVSSGVMRLMASGIRSARRVTGLIPFVVERGKQPKESWRFPRRMTSATGNSTTRACRAREH